jgi:NAD(P)-dependent dehydrogenase (short-subunit alcohol dehydrogenase family)
MMQKTWFVTGASRGFGVEIAKAAIRSGDRVVATARKRTALVDELGPDSGQLMSVELDVTNAAQAQTAVDAAIKRFGGIDVLVNNAGYGHMGFFEEMTMEDVQQQFATNLFGVFNVTWAVLPSMRAARKGRIFNISSLGGLIGVPFGSLYCSSKFALEGFSESLSGEISPFGLSVTIVEPGPFRTDFLTPESARFRGKPIADYDDRRAHTRAGFEERNGFQPGDPARLAEAIVRLADEPNPPLRFLAGALAVNATEEKLRVMRAEFEKRKELSLSTDGDYTDSRLGNLGALRPSK